MIKKIINKIKENRWVLRSIIPTIYFNFHYLPFRQAIKLPIFLYKPHLKLMKGTITIMGGGDYWYDTIGEKSSKYLS